MTFHACSGAAVTRARALLVYSWIALLAVGCESGASVADSPRMLGQARLELREVPDGVQCIRVTVLGGGQAVTRDFGVEPAAAASLQLTGLPVGPATFSGLAYSAACSDVTASTTPSWSSAPVDVQVGADGPASVRLVMRPYVPTQVNVDVEFEQDAGGPASLCENGASEQRPCGNCGTQFRVCEDSAWGEWSFCQGAGECTPGALEACGDGGERICSTECRWDACINERCMEAGSTTRSCGFCGTQTVTCDASTGMAIYGECTGAGECQAGTVESCGGTGERVCDMTCRWSACL